MYDNHQNIIGHQWIKSQCGGGIYVQLPNLKEKDWQFTTDLANSATTSIYAKDNLDKPMITII